MNNHSGTKKFGLLGSPLGHSLSPYIHKRIFELCGMNDYEYDLYEVNPGELSFKGDCIKELSGFNVTIPYKTEIIPYLNRLDKSAERYGAVNCVNFNGNEHIGYNTDGFGFLKCIEELGANLRSRVLLLGCGGTGRMMAIEAISAGADLTVAIRKTSSAEKAAASLSREIADITGRSITHTAPLGQTGQIQMSRMRITYIDTLNLVNEYDLLLNSTPCGMFPNVDEIPIVPEILGKVRYLFDAVYNPHPTKLIEQAEKRGVKTLGGLPMLVYQAVMSQTIWNDLQVSENIVRAIISEVKQKL
ncbi:MAG: shikimate dehydrogenase [Oscillospiraceae bacterium]|nr:shikimate dehydrogenase [Oscillospiraceae bacterium]